MISEEVKKLAVLCQTEQRKVINVGYHFSIEEIEYLKSLDVHRSKMMSFMEASGKYPHNDYLVDYECCSCHKNVTGESSKTKLIGLILDNNPLMCVDCFEELKEKKKRRLNEHNSIEQEKRIVLIKENTQTYIEEMLKTEFSRVKIDWGFVDNYYVDRDIVAALLKNLSYRDFLGTYYWFVVRRRVLRKYDYKCGLCNEKNELHVHHKTYVNHGYELEHTQDLIPLCAKCHEKFHDIVVT